MENKNYSYFMNTNLEDYIGKWIAICNKKIVASGLNAKEVYIEAKKTCPFERPLLSKIPEKDTMIL